ncbi:hypothetical protein HID58_058730 [Brassica napus]|uniref:40S ribosomal protein S4 n=1 Tax=Brassica napus TaxID=3708 RepID=A0ABQ7ZQX6_BRANA|nr:hypothetical protein HID58_058730 [Brassica napus]
MEHGNHNLRSSQGHARGMKKHLKRLNAPKHWMLDKLGGAFAPKPSSGPHKSRECLPLVLIIRNRLKYALTYRIFRYPDPLIKPNDTIKLDLEENKIVEFIKFDVGNVVLNREKHKGSFETIHIQDSTGHEFATRLGNVFTLGKGTKPWASLPKGKGIKLTIIEEARKRLSTQQAA